MAFEQTIARLNSYKDNFRVTQAMGIVVMEAQRRCPVDTGYLKAHWEIKRIRGGVWSIIFSADYAVYVHERLDVYHRIGEAKFLEKAWNHKKNEFLRALYDW